MPNRNKENQKHVHKAITAKDNNVREKQRRNANGRKTYRKK